MKTLWHITIIFLLAILLVQCREDDDPTGEGASHQPTKPNDRCSPSSLRGIIAETSTATLAAGRTQAKKGGFHGVVHNSKRTFHYVNNTYRHLRATREYGMMSRQYRKALGYTTRPRFSLDIVGGAPQQALGALLDIPLSRTKETEAIARLAGLHLNEVTAPASTLQGSVLFTQDFISAVVEAITEYPYEFAYFLWQYALYSLRCFGYGFWRFKLCAFSLIILYARRHGNGKRAAFLLIMIGLCGYLSGLQF